MPQDDFSTLFDLLPIGAYRSSPEGRQLRANAALLRLDGYATEAEMLAATHDLAQEWYVDPARRAQFKSELSAQGRVVDFDSEVYRHKTRERIWVRVHAHVVRDAAGQVLYYEGTVQDITQERSARMALLASERRFRAIAEKAQLLTIIFDAGGLLTYASPAAQTLLGVAPGAMLGSHFLDWVHPDDVADARTEMARKFRLENSGEE
jgi:PAS domain S-box-containing protein